MQSSERFPENVRLALANQKLRSHLSRLMPALYQRGHKALLEGWNPEFERLREKGRAIKAEAIEKIDHYLEEFSANVVKAGGTVYRAADAAAANRYVIELARRHGVTSAVKAKSMATEEIRLNEALTAAGIEPVETDLGQLINQLAADDPFHMVGPAMHHPRADVGELFARKLGVERTEELVPLARIARQHMRRRFHEAGMGISGVNFGVAETGTVVICENEGNIGLSTTVPRKVHVAIMGIEKLIPRAADLATMLVLLARAGSGIPMFKYVSMLTGQRGPGGPAEFHVVLLDNGRAAMARDPIMSEALRCIRCGACQGACPVYLEVGGHAYGSIYQGPIGAVISPQLGGFAPADDLPHASTLCGACADVCPVKIPIPHLLLELRRRSAGRSPWPLRVGIRLWAFAMSTLARYRITYALARRLQRWLGGRRIPRWLPLAGAWSVGRELPPAPAVPFRERWKARR